MVLIGREQELVDLDERLRSHRLVTVVGPGGVGKTTVADEAASRAASRFPMGTGRVDLTRVEAPDAVRGAVAAQLGFDSWEALLASPNDRPLLLVVDNCEHLLDAASATVAEVLAVCELPTVLATSRSPLELPGEAVVPLAPLPVPPAGHPSPADFESVQLFVSRADVAGANVPLDHLDEVGHLCRRLDGVPLAIELAAARCRSLSIGEIVARLDHGVGVLERRHYRGESRHRSIVDTIRWSYDLLDPAAACLLRQLSVFAGPFTARSALRVVAAERPEAEGTFDDDLDELVHVSIIAADTTGEETRYRLFETVRRFARDQLEEGGELERAMDAFVDAVLGAASEATRGGTSVWRPEMITELLADFDDLAEALRWANDHDSDPTRALTLCGLLWTVVHQGRADDVLLLARRTIDRWEGADHPRYGAAIATLATAEYLTGDPARALAIAEPAVHDLAPGGTGPVKLHRLIGQACSALGDLDGAIAAFAAGAELARSRGMTAMAIELDIVHAHARSVVGAASVELDLEASWREAETLGSPITAAWAGTTLGWLLLRNDQERGLEVVTDALARSRSIDYPIGIAGNLRSLAYAYLLGDDLAAARSALLELVDHLVRRGALSDLRLLLDVTAAFAHRAGHPHWPVLAATARALPIVSLLLTPGSEPFALPLSAAAPLRRADAVLAVRQVLDDLADLDGAAPAVPAAPPPVGPGIDARFVSLGDSWQVAYDGVDVTIRASKGMTDLARLLAHPDREVHCLDLVGAGVEERSTGEVIDATARRRYEDRIRDLQQEIDEAEAGNDVARAERAQVEFDTIVDHLTAALGPGGRTRRATGTQERARSAVTQRIRSTIRRIGEENPTLGRHLQVSVKTGMWCCYRPEHPVNWITRRRTP